MYLIEQTGLTCCLLLAVGFSAGMRRCHPLRLLGVSAGTALICAGMADAPPLMRGGMLLLCAVCAPMLAWPDVPGRLKSRMIAAGSFLSLGMTGMMRLMHPFALPAGLMVLLCCLLLLAMPCLVPRPEDTPRLATLDIRHGAHHLTLTGLIDSGNLLRDGVTGLPVVVVSRRAAERLVQLPNRGRLTYPFRLLTVRTISGTSLMTVFHPESVCVKTPSGWQRVETLLGVSPDGYDGFQALVPSCLLMQEAGCLQLEASESE